MNIYTKTGDTGTTSLYGGKRVNKNNARIYAIGAVDELNSYLGLAVSQIEDESIKNKLVRIQKELFELGADLATPEDVNHNLKQIRISEEKIKELEVQIDYWDAELPKLTHFILPGGLLIASIIYHARAVCRRAEREITHLDSLEPVNALALKYINRLSDWLFVLARFINYKNSVSEVIWKSEEK